MAPPRVNSPMMGVVFLSLFVSNNLMGWLGRFYEKIGPTAFWTLHTAIAAAGGVLALVLMRPLERALNGSGTAPPP